MNSRNPMKDRVAFAGAASTGYFPRNTDRTQASYTAEACLAALRACGLRASDVDGVCGSSPSAPVVQSMLGIPEVTWFANPAIPFVNQLAMSAAAVHAGLCDIVLAYHAPYRLAWNTGSAVKDPFRRIMPDIRGGGGYAGPDSLAGSPGYTAWASRYMHDYNAPKEHFGYIAVSDRSYAADNPLAALRAPMTMDDYLHGRMVRWPLCLYDMDIAVDGADAFIITTAERARDMALPPVLVNAVALGNIDLNDEAQIPSLDRHGQQVVVNALRAKGDFWIDDIDVYFPYDGFTIITLSWIENVGYCGRGEAGSFIESNWDAQRSRLMIGGRVPVNPHGGSLSEGASQGSGHIREAVHQLQGLAGSRQVDGARTALVTAGGFFFNAQGVALRAD